MRHDPDLDAQIDRVVALMPIIVASSADPESIVLTAGPTAGSATRSAPMPPGSSSPICHTRPCSP